MAKKTPNVEPEFEFTSSLRIGQLEDEVVKRKMARLDNTLVSIE